MAMALAASLISIRVGISVALIEILIGAIVGNLPHASSYVQQTHSFILPFLGPFAFCFWALSWSPHASLIGGIALSTTSVAVVYAVMVETGLNRQEIGKLILAACFVTDLGTVLALGGFFANVD